MTYIWVNISSGNGLLPDSTKALPKPVLVYHQWGLLAFSWVLFQRNCFRYHSLQNIWKSIIWKYCHINQGPMGSNSIHISQEPISAFSFQSCCCCFPDSGPRKSGVMVEFSDLGFHLRSPGDFLDEEIDEIVNFLNSRVTTQEKTDLAQLRRFYRTLARYVPWTNWQLSARLQ